MDNLIGKDELQILSKEAAHAEYLGQLTAIQLDILYRRRLFNLFVPESLGGLALTLPEAIGLQEQLAYTDGSVGWTATLCAGASWFVGYMDPALSESMFANHQICFGGSGMDTGTAELQTDGSYIINGYWRYATGAPHLNVFTTNCRLQINGVGLLDENNKPVVRSFCLLRNEVEIVNDWNTMGLKATASHAFRVSGLRVGAERSFRISPDDAVREEAIYRFPFGSFAELTLAANYLGMFNRFIDLSGEDPEGVKHFVPNNVLQEIADSGWQQLMEIGTLEPGLVERIRVVCSELVHSGFQEVLSRFPSTGIHGATLDTELNRVWRDIFTASQHVIFR